MESVAQRRAARLLAHFACNEELVSPVEFQDTAAEVDRLAQFNAVFDTLASDLITEISNEYDMPADAIQYIKKLLYYTVPGGKMNRGLSVLDSYKALVNRPVTDAEVFKSIVLGWAVEWLQAFFLVADDLMDDSHTRRGAPCWFRLEGVGLIAANDSLLLESCIYKVLKRHFRNEPYYVSLVELMQEVTYKTELGQLLDLRTASGDKVDLSRFTLDTYNRIVKYKTAYYSFYLPVALALLQAGYDGQQHVFDTAMQILLPMGEYFQIQDDFLDCYGDEKTIGKIGTDIQDNKCGWLVVQALLRVTPAQRQILERNYAKKDPKCVAAVKQLYLDLNMPKIFADYEEQAHQNIQKLISEAKGVPTAVFTMFLAKIFKRKL